VGFYSTMGPLQGVMKLFLRHVSSVNDFPQKHDKRIVMSTSVMVLLHP
jgi:hypothetical protein